MAEARSAVHLIAFATAVRFVFSDGHVAKSRRFWISASKNLGNVSYKIRKKSINLLNGEMSINKLQQFYRLLFFYKLSKQYNRQLCF